MFEKSNNLFYKNNSEVSNSKKLLHISQVIKNKVYFLKVFSTLNNTYVTLTNNLGQIIFMSSGGCSKISSSKRNTTYNLELILNTLTKKLDTLNIKNLILNLDLLSLRKKKSILKVLKNFKIKVLGIKLKTVKAFNGVRPCKRRRI